MEVIESMPKLKKFQELSSSYRLKTNGSTMMDKIQAEESILIASTQSKTKYLILPRDLITLRV